MRNIAVLVYELTIEYNTTVLDGISKFFEDKKDIKLIISPINVPKSSSAEFDYQYWTGLKVLASEEIDAYIVITNSFLSYISADELSKQLRVLAPKPVISVSVPLDVENNTCVCVSCEETYELIVEHLVKKHNKTKIGYFTAELTYSEESKLRFNAFKKALAKYNIEYNEDFIFHGDFTPGVAKEKFCERIKSKDDVKFEAILCANDYTALGVLSAFNGMGVKCPEEVILFGFDDANIALESVPTLSTVNQAVSKTGFVAAEAAYDIINGKSRESKIVIPTEPIYRQSCGCFKTVVGDSSSYDKDGVLHDHSSKIEARRKDYARNAASFTTIYSLLNSVETNSDFEVYLNNLMQDYKSDHVYELSIVLYKEPIVLKKEDDFQIPDEAYLIFYSNKNTHTHGLFLGENKIIFNPKEVIIPRDIRIDLYGKHLLIPIYNKDMNYGYLMFHFYSTNYPLITIYAKILSNSIFHAYSNSKNILAQKELILENKDLSIKSKTDELTGILNRRGFFEYGEKLALLSASMGKMGGILFFDLDGLKIINDTYGHETGDLAIKLEAQVIKAAFRDTDVVGRLSGDEFGVVAPGFPSRKMDFLREKIRKLNEEVSKENNLPFTLSVSVGCVDFSLENFDFQHFLTLADEKLYEEKRKKHDKK